MQRVASLLDDAFEFVCGRDCAVHVTYLPELDDNISPPSILKIESSLLQASRTEEQLAKHWKDRS